MSLLYLCFKLCSVFSALQPNISAFNFSSFSTNLTYYDRFIANSMEESFVDPVNHDLMNFIGSRIGIHRIGKLKNKNQTKLKYTTKDDYIPSENFFTNLKKKIINFFINLSISNLLKQNNLLLSNTTEQNFEIVDDGSVNILTKNDNGTSVISKTEYSSNDSKVISEDEITVQNPNLFENITDQNHLLFENISISNNAEQNYYLLKNFLKIYLKQNKKFNDDDLKYKKDDDSLTISNVTSSLRHILINDTVKEDDYKFEKKLIKYNPLLRSILYENYLLMKKNKSNNTRSQYKNKTVITEI